MMDCLVISAFTRVFNALCPAMTARGSAFHRARRFSSPATASLAARHVQAGIEELQGGVGDRRVDLAAVDAGIVDAGLRKFISAVIVTFIDEDVVTRPGMT